MSAAASLPAGGSGVGRPENVGILAADVYFPSTFVAQVSVARILLYDGTYDIVIRRYMCARDAVETMRCGVVRCRAVPRAGWAYNSSTGKSVGLRARPQKYCYSTYLN